MKLSKKNLEKYMKKEGIETDFQLLVTILTKLGKPEPYKMAMVERSNFSRMVNGKASLKVEYIIPLETIFRIPIVKLTNQDYYSEPSIEFIPYVKGFRYYAYKDNPKSYEEEFAKVMAIDERHSILVNQDEFGKTFFDYVVLYKSINAIKFLQKNYGLKSHWMNDTLFQITFNGAQEVVFGDNVEVAKIILEKNEIDLFYKIFDFNSYFHLYHLDLEPFYKSDEITELLLKNQSGFESLFREYKTKFTELNKRVSMVGNISAKDFGDVVRINPLINRCLDFGVKHLDKYKDQVVEILTYGKKYNSKVLKTLNEKYSLTSYDLYTYEFGDLYTGRDVAIASLVVFNGDFNNVKDQEVIQLLNELPAVTKRK